MIIGGYEYYKEVKELSNNLIEQVIYDLKNEGEEVCYRSVKDKINDDSYIFEAVDSHSYIIYTAKAFKVLEYSDNISYFFDNIGFEGKKISFLSDIITPIAFWSMYADVQDEINKQLEDWEFN